MEERDLELEQKLKDLCAKRSVLDIRAFFEDNNIVDLAAVVEELDIKDAVFIFKILPKDTSGDLFSYLQPEKQEKLIYLLTSREVKSIIDNLYSDDIIDFIEEMPEEIVKKVLKSVDPEDRAQINALLSYGENTCGSIMTTDYVELNENITVAKAMEEVKEQREIAESIAVCFVTNDTGELTGVMSIRDILFAPENGLVKDEMETDVVYVKTNDDQEEAVKLFQRYDFSKLPVVDERMKLVGMITSDDVIDVIEDEATEDIHKMAGINPIETPYLHTSALAIAASRIPWLLVLMLSATLSGSILIKNEYLLLLFPALSIFEPMLMDTAGNAGSQAASMVIRGIVVDNLSMKDFFKIFWKEFFIALLCGITLFAVNLIRIYFFMANIDMRIALVSSLTIIVVVLCAKLVGGLLPLIATRFKLDPAVLASPLITTIVDCVSLTVYFALVKAFML
ncbi:MAG: magnesium transporter [Erysipelotrichaceae bacterium]|nr:magnesium transporter [Erysipelotrichaceae bacterium]